jgi:predicted CopG family antitoxin
MSNSTILEPEPGSTSNKKNISVSTRTYDRLVALGKFSDRTFDHLISRLIDERQKLEIDSSDGGSW